MTKKEREEQQILLSHRIDDIWKRIRQIDEKAKSVKEFNGWYHYCKRFRTPTLDGDNDFSELYEEVCKDSYDGLMQERKQLFELYQITLKRLHALYGVK